MHGQMKFQDSVYQKAKVCSQTINELRISKGSVVLLRRQGPITIDLLCYVFKESTISMIRDYIQITLMNIIIRPLFLCVFFMMIKSTFIVKTYVL